MAKKRADATEPRKPPESDLGWWGQQWLRYLRGLGVGPGSDSQLRSARRSLARLTVARGRVEAEVPVGQSGHVEKAVLKVRPLAEKQWRRVVDAVAADPDVAARLLTGAMGPDLEAVFADLGLALFPEPPGLAPVRCSCRVRSCRHLNVLAVQGAALVDGNPFLWLEALGMERAELFAQVRARLADGGHPVPAAGEVALTEAAEPARPLAAERFWQTDVDPGTIPVRPGGSVLPDAVLRLLGPLPVPEAPGEVATVTLREQVVGKTRITLPVPGRVPADELLRRYVVRIGTAAAALAAGERAPAHSPGEALPGKPVPPGVRLAPEVAEAVRQAGTLLSLEQLRPRCPTAAAVADGSWRRMLADALSYLPPDLVALAGCWAGSRAAVLRGAAFRHVVTLADCLRGDLGPDADWVRALQVAGCQPPYRVEAGGKPCTVVDQGARPSAAPRPGSLFAELQPEVGDEIQFTVVDPEQPLLAATLTRRAARTYTSLQEPNLAAARALAGHMAATGQEQLSEQGAVAVLLAERRYRERISPDPVWLLPLQVEGLYSPPRGRGVTRLWNNWQPSFGRLAYDYWPAEGEALARFTVALANRGAGRREVEAALACVRRWCQHWPGAQDDVRKPAGAGAFLDFLWNVAPLALGRYAPELVTRSLAAWFDFLCERQPALREAYQAQRAACGYVEAYAHRRRTAPPVRRDTDPALWAWKVEAYRWIGADWCLDQIRHRNR